MRRRGGRTAVAGPLAAAIATALGGLGLAACTPRIAVEAPSKPITINMNIKIEHEIRVKVDHDLEQAFAKQGDIF
jgi:hypothetical protein